MLPFSYQSSFEKLSKHQNNPQMLSQLKPLISALEESRKSIQFHPQKEFTLSDTLFNKTSSSIKDYLKLAIKLPLYIDLPIGQDGINSFEWTSRTQDSSFKNKNFFYELSCHYYNLSILNFNYALSMHISDYQQNPKTIARVFRTSIWASLRAAEYSQKCSKTGSIPIEIQLDSLKMIYDMGQVLIHSIFLRELDNSNESKDSDLYKGTLVKIFRSSSRLMMVKGQSIFSLWMDKSLMGSIIQESHFRTKAQIYLRLAGQFREQNKLNPKSDGLACLVSVQMSLKQDIQEFQEFANGSKNKNLTNLLLQVKDLTQDLKDNQDLLKNVHNKVAPNIKEIPLPPFNDQIYPLEESDLFVEHPLVEQCCQGMQSQLYISYENMLKVIILEKRESITILKNELMSQKQEFYRGFNLDALLLDPQTLSNKALTITQDVIQQKGGYQGYASILKQILDMQPKIEYQFNQID